VAGDWGTSLVIVMRLYVRGFVQPDHRWKPQSGEAHAALRLSPTRCSVDSFGASTTLERRVFQSSGHRAGLAPPPRVRKSRATNTKLPLLVDGALAGNPFRCRFFRLIGIFQKKPGSD
jgi:hypothetical protein